MQSAVLESKELGHRAHVKVEKYGMGISQFHLQLKQGVSLCKKGQILQIMCFLLVVTMSCRCQKIIKGDPGVRFMRSLVHAFHHVLSLGVFRLEVVYNSLVFKLDLGLPHTHDLDLDIRVIWVFSIASIPRLSRSDPKSVGVS